MKHWKRHWYVWVSKFESLLKWMPVLFRLFHWHPLDCFAFQFQHIFTVVKQSKLDPKISVLLFFHYIFSPPEISFRIWFLCKQSRGVEEDTKKMFRVEKKNLLLYVILGFVFKESAKANVLKRHTKIQVCMNLCQSSQHGCLPFEKLQTIQHTLPLFTSIFHLPRSFSLLMNSILQLNKWQVAWCLYMLEKIPVRAHSSNIEMKTHKQKLC